MCLNYSLPGKEPKFNLFVFVFVFVFAGGSYTER